MPSLLEKDQVSGLLYGSLFLLDTKESTCITFFTLILISFGVFYFDERHSDTRSDTVVDKWCQDYHDAILICGNNY